MTGKRKPAGTMSLSSKIETAIIRAGNHLADIPQQSMDQPDDRRARLLAWTIIFLTLAMIPAGLIIAFSQRYANKVQLLTLAIPAAYILLLTGSFHLNRKRLCRVAALTTVLGGAAAVWVFLLINQYHYEEVDLIALFYVTLSILLASFLLNTWQTVLLALAQGAGLIILLNQDNSWAELDWQNLFAFMLSVSILSFCISYITQTDMRQIERQNRQLMANEAVLKDLATRDSLTNLYNLHYLLETLPRELSRIARHNSTLGVIALDIDHFKTIDQQHGHAAADQLLKEVAQLVKKKIRDSDIACRYGGDEFILVLPDASLAAVLDRAESLRKSILQEDFKTAVPGLAGITVSCGVAAYPQNGQSATDLLKAASEALSLAKQAGRNRSSAAAVINPVQLDQESEL